MSTRCRGAIKAVKDEGYIALVNAWSVVAHRQLPIAESDCNVATGGTPFHGVVKQYKQYAGVAFWLYVTRDWVAEPAGIK